MAEIESLTTSAIIALINNGTWPPQFTPSAANLVAINDALTVDVHQAASIAIGLKNTGTVADILGVVVFEASVNSTTGTDGDWTPIQMGHSGDNTIETGRAATSLAAGVAQNYAWEASVAAYQWFRVRMTTAVTASAIQKWSAAVSAYATEPIPSIQSHPVTVSGTPTVSNTPAAGSSSLVISAATINAAVIKASAGNLYEVTAFNSTAAIVYLKFYNKATTPAPATDGALLMLVIAVPIGGGVSQSFGSIGKRFAAGISMAIVANPANTDATAVAAGVDYSSTFI